MAEANAVERQYRLTGLTCADCAAKLERHVQGLPGIEDARLNFMAAKLVVVGDIQDDRLQEEIKKVEDVTIHPIDGADSEPRPAWWTQGQVVTTALSLLFLLAGLLLSGQVWWSRSLLLLSMLAGGYSMVYKGIRHLLKLNFDMYVLMTVAITGALLIGEWIEAAVVVFLFAVSEMLEAYSMERARRSIRSLMEVAPREAIVLRDGAEHRVPVEQLEVGDVILVRPGEKIAMDGVIVEGSTAINEAAITGESLPVEKTAGDTVYAGTLNQQGAVQVRVTKRVEDTTISKIIHLVEEAQSEKAPSQAFIDRFAKVYTPLVMALSVLVMTLPPLIAGNWQHWLYQGLALLVVACPCALVISTPVAIVSAIGRAARSGVLIKGGVHLEEVGRLKAVAFDKTGTLTRGEPVVTDVQGWHGLSRPEVLQLAASLERMSEHPLAKAIVREAEQSGLSLLPVEDFTAIPGQGATAAVGGQSYAIGNERLFADHPDLSDVEPLMAAYREQGKTAVILGDRERVLGLIAVADQVREESAQVIAALEQEGIATAMLTGDNRQAAGSIARQVGIGQYDAELMPEDKLAQIKRLQAKYGKVAMVGDGINDAPSLAAATVGIAMGGAGTDTALETADIALMADDLGKLPFTVRLGRKAVRIIKQNITLALGAKLLAVLLVVPGWLTLWLAILADVGATLLVTFNGMRLLYVKDKKA